MDTHKLQKKNDEIMLNEWREMMRTSSHRTLLKVLRNASEYTAEQVAIAKEVVIEKLLEANDPIKKTTKTSTRKLFMSTLKKIGCSYKIDKDDDQIGFMYQGEYFFAEASDDDPFVLVRDHGWTVTYMADVDEVSRVRRSVNEVNLRSFVSLSYAVDDECKELYTVSWNSFIFIPEIRELTTYLRIQLNRFIRAHRAFDTSMDKLLQAEREQ